MLFCLLKHYLDTALKVSQSVYCFTTSISHGVENYFPRLWDMGISDAIFVFCKVNRSQFLNLMLHIYITVEPQLSEPNGRHSIGLDNRGVWIDEGN